MSQVPPNVSDLSPRDDWSAVLQPSQRACCAALSVGFELWSGVTHPGSPGDAHGAQLRVCAGPASREPSSGPETRAGLRGDEDTCVGADLTSVKCKGKWLLLGIAVDPLTGLVLSVDALSAEDTQTLREWIEPIAHSVGAQVLVTDDADGFKTIADEIGTQHQVCKSHVKRNTDALIERLQPLVAQNADGSLAVIGVSREQATADLQRLGELVSSRRREDGAELEALHRRYLAAAPPREGERQSLAYRLRLLYLDRWNLWHRLTRYRHWQGPKHETLDGTNNACERAIGWWVKERYRSMRGYKVPQNAERVSRLLTWCGNFLYRGGAELEMLLS